MNTRWYRWFLIAGVVLPFCLVAVRASADSGRRSLEGLAGVYVQVEPPGADAERDGLTRDLMRKDAEALLRQAGIPVYGKDEWLRAPGNPSLYINANVLKLKETGEYIYAITIALKENVYLLREPVEIWGSATWSKGGVVGITGHLEKIRTSVKREIMAFIDAVRSQNRR